MSGGTYEISAEALAQLEHFIPREARYAYWQKGGGPMFVYNTERIHTPHPGDRGNGCFESAVFVPYGPGSRSGKATRWRVLERSRSLHDLRKDAKARAWRLYQGWLASGKVEL
jgi:hypothetical protein